MEHLPKTVQECVDYYLPKFEGMDSYFEMNENEFASFCHSQLSGGIGMKIRNELGFWTKNTKIYEHMVSVYKLEHPDSMSDLIIREVYKKVKG